MLKEQESKQSIQISEENQKNSKNQQNQDDNNFIIKIKHNFLYYSIRLIQTCPVLSVDFNNPTKPVNLKQIIQMNKLRPSQQQPSFTKYFLEDPSLLEHMNDKQKKKIVLYDLPQIQQYRNLNKPVVSEEKKRIIKEKLDLQQQSLLQTKQREKRNQFFLTYSQNPFIDLSPHTNVNRQALKHHKEMAKEIHLKSTEKDADQQNQQQQKQKHDSGGVRVQDIVEQLNTMTEKSPKPQFLKMKYDFTKMMREADLFSNKIIELSTRPDEIGYFDESKMQPQLLVGTILQKGMAMAREAGTRKFSEHDEMRKRSNTTLSAQEMKETKRETSSNPILDRLPQTTMTFDEIISIKQQNYFMKPVPLNIFKIAFNKNQKEMIGKELLDKYNMSFTSMVEKLQKIKIPIYRDISRMARRISLNISTGKEDRFDYIDSYELSFKTNLLNFADLMSVASGRFSPEFVYKTTNFDMQQNMIKEKSQTSSQQEQEEQIIYPQETENQSVRFYNKGQEQQQIINYLKLQYNSKELEYKTQCQRYKKSIHTELQMKQKLVSTTIQDKQLHGVISRSIKKQLDQFVRLDERDVEIDRLIRMNKMNKTKNVAIKMNKVLEAFQLKRQHDEVVDRLGIVQEENQLDDYQVENEENYGSNRKGGLNKLAISTLVKGNNNNTMKNNLNKSSYNNLNLSMTMNHKPNPNQPLLSNKTPQKQSNREVTPTKPRWAITGKSITPKKSVTPTKGSKTNGQSRYDNTRSPLKSSGQNRNDDRTAKKPTSMWRI